MPSAVAYHPVTGEIKKITGGRTVPVYATVAAALAEDERLRIKD